jgi:hypothetical protein
MAKRQVAILVGLAMAVVCELCAGAYVVISEEKLYREARMPTSQPTATRPPTSTWPPTWTSTPKLTNTPVFWPTDTPTSSPVPTNTLLPTNTPYIAPTSTPVPQPPPPPSPTKVPAAVCGCSGNIYNCSDFSTHAQAQACYEYCKSIGRGDIHDLDRDNDGSACESLR